MNSKIQKMCEKLRVCNKDVYITYDASENDVPYEVEINNDKVGDFTLVEDVEEELASLLKLVKVDLTIQLKDLFVKRDEIIKELRQVSEDMIMCTMMLNKELSDINYKIDKIEKAKLDEV